MCENIFTESETRWRKEFKQIKDPGQRRQVYIEYLSKVSFSLHFILFILPLSCHHGCEADRHDPDGGGPLFAGPRSVLPATLHIWWEFNHAPWHHTTCSPQKDGWGLPRHRCFWGTGLQPVCKLCILTETTATLCISVQWIEDIFPCD